MISGGDILFDVESVAMLKESDSSGLIKAANRPEYCRLSLADIGEAVICGTILCWHNGCY